MTVAGYLEVYPVEGPEVLVAYLVCDKEGKATPHMFAETLVARDAAGGVLRYDHMFECASCGRRRRWGCVGPAGDDAA